MCALGNPKPTVLIPLGGNLKSRRCVWKKHAASHARLIMCFRSWEIRARLREEQLLGCSLKWAIQTQRPSTAHTDACMESGTKYKKKRTNKSALLHTKPEILGRLICFIIWIQGWFLNHLASKYLIKVSNFIFFSPKNDEIWHSHF